MDINSVFQIVVFPLSITGVLHGKTPNPFADKKQKDFNFSIFKTDVIVEDKNII